jgi:hypothetical protein
LRADAAESIAHVEANALVLRYRGVRVRIQGGLSSVGVLAAIPALPPGHRKPSNPRGARLASCGSGPPPPQRTSPNLARRIEGGYALRVREGQAARTIGSDPDDIAASSERVTDARRPSQLRSRSQSA